MKLLKKTVIYVSNQEQGSSIIHLVEFFIASSEARNGKQRPADALKFGKLLQKNAVPVTAYGKGKQNFVDKITSAP